MIKKKKIIIGASAIVACSMLAVSVISAKQNSQSMPQIETQSTYVVPNQKKVILSGSVVPSQFKTFTTDPTKSDDFTIHVNHGDSVHEGDVLITYYNQEITSQIQDLKEQMATLTEKKSKLMQDGTPAARSINKQIKSIETQKTKLQQDTKSQINQILKKLEEVVKQKSALDPQDENYGALVAEFDAQIENCYVQKNELEYHLPTQLAEFDEQVADLKSQLSDEDQETFNGLDEQINNLSKEVKKLEEKEYVKEIAPFNGVVTLVEDSNADNPITLKLKSPDFYVTASVGVSW